MSLNLNFKSNIYTLNYNINNKINILIIKSYLSNIKQGKNKYSSDNLFN
jgi:hypothetical protein